MANISPTANLLGGGVLVQRTGRFLSGRRQRRGAPTAGMVEPTLKAATPGRFESSVAVSLSGQHSRNAAGARCSGTGRVFSAYPTLRRRS